MMFSLRILQNLSTVLTLLKLGFVADYEGRSVNSHILVLIRENIRAFEQAHGVIDGSVNPAENVKPARKNP